MRKTSLALAILFLPLAAIAETPATAPATGTSAYAVPVESIVIGKAKGKFLETALAIGDYNFFSTMNTTQRDSGISIMGSEKRKATVTVAFRFTKSDATPVSTGQCTIESKSWSGLWNTVQNSLYTCQLKGLGAADYALEVAVPNIAPQGGGFISMQKDEPDKYKILKAKLRYKGVTYEAVPTALDPRMEDYHQRVAKGYVITQDGKLIGRIDFHPNFPDRGTVTAPLAEADGREAVIFLSVQLLEMPEANSPALR